MTMKLTKGMKIKETKENTNPLFANTTANSVLVYEVIRVNKNTYSLKCIDGYMKNTKCNLSKNVKPESVDVYGTVTKWEIVL